MFKFTIFVAICCAFAYQSFAAIASPELRSTEDEVKKAFHKMMESVDQVLVEAKTALDNAMTTVKAKATEVETAANGQVDQLLNPLRQKLDDLIAQTKAKGFDVTKCQTYIDDFSQTPDHLVHNLVECVNTQVSKAQGYVDDALNNVQTIEKDLDTIDKEIDNCGGNVFKKALCYAKLLTKIADDAQTAPVAIMNDVGNATNLIQNIGPILEDCANAQVDKAGTDATKDVKDFAVCVAIPF